MQAAGTVAFIATLVLVVVFHELGHLLTAKKYGMKVDAFFVGFGPRVFSRTRGETEYGLRAIPLGGYVKIVGMNPFVPVAPQDAPRAFSARPSWQRAVVLSAGSATHFVLAFLMLALTLATVGLPEATTTIDEVQKELDGQDSPAFLAGITPGDKIIAIDGEPISDWERVREAIRSKPGEGLTIRLERDGKVISIGLVPAAFEERDASGTVRVGRLGIVPTSINVRASIPTSLRLGATWVGLLTVDSLRGVGYIFSPSGIGRIFEALGGRSRGEGDPIGLVGGARVAGQAAEAGETVGLVQLLAHFVIFIGVVNLLPLPILDGGYLAVVAFEKVFRRKVDLRRLAPVAMVVLGFFVMLAVALLYLDIARPVPNPLQ